MSHHGIRAWQHVNSDFKMLMCSARRTPRHYSQLCLEHLNGKARGAWSKLSLRFLLEFFWNIRVCCVHDFDGKNGSVSDLQSDFSIYNHMRYRFQCQHCYDLQLSRALQYEGCDLVLLSCRGTDQNTTTCCDMCDKFSYAWLMWCVFLPYGPVWTEVMLHVGWFATWFVAEHVHCKTGQFLLWVDGRAMTMTMTIHDPLCDWVDCWVGAPDK